jgi:hypothetical protein
LACEGGRRAFRFLLCLPSGPATKTNISVIKYKHLGSNDDNFATAMLKTLSAKYLSPSAPAARDDVAGEGRKESDEGMGGM